MRIACLAAAVVLIAGVAQAEPRYKTIEADNGLQYRLDMSSIDTWGPGERSIIIIPMENGEMNKARYQNLRFTCKGYVWDMKNSAESPVYIPPRSLLADIARIVCQH